MVDFRHLLRKPLGEIKAPPALPVGSAYRGIITGNTIASIKTKEGKELPILKFQIRVTEWSEEIAEEDKEGLSLDGRRFSKDFFLLDKEGNDQLIYVKRFFKALGLDVENEDQPAEELLPETTGREVMFELTQRFNEKDNVTENQIGKITGA